MDVYYFSSEYKGEKEKRLSKTDNDCRIKRFNSREVEFVNTSLQVAK